MEYEAAHGATIPSGGEQHITAFTEEDKEKHMVDQICEVNQGRLIVSKVVKAGNCVVVL